VEIEAFMVINERASRGKGRVQKTSQSGIVTVGKTAVCVCVCVCVCEGNISV